MKFGKLYDAVKYVALGVVCFLITGFLYVTLQEVRTESLVKNELQVMPNYNYVPDIKKLEDEGKLMEAIEMARFVIRHPDMPNQAEVKELEKRLERKRTSFGGRSARAGKGFFLGTGNSIEELVGSITSDMVFWGDFRDLCKQGYFKATGAPVDPVLATLAGVGLLTEMVDVVDWAPAVLKAFRKMGVLSKKFSDVLVTACRKSKKAGKANGDLMSIFKNLDGLVSRVGLSRASSMFKYVDAPGDLRVITKVAQKSPDVAYFTLKNGGRDGVVLLKRLGHTEEGISMMATAAKKGPRGIQWLKKGGAGRKVLIKTRVTARVLKNLHLHRFQQLIAEVVKKYSGVLYILWSFLGLSLLGGGLCMVEAG